MSCATALPSHLETPDWGVHPCNLHADAARIQVLEQKMAETQKDVVQQRLLLLRQSRKTRTYQMIGKVCEACTSDPLSCGRLLLLATSMSLVHMVQDVRRDAAKRAASMLPGLPAMQQDDRVVQIAVQAMHRAFNLGAIPPTGTVFKRPAKGGHWPCCIHDGVLRITPFMTRAQAAMHARGKYTGWQHIKVWHVDQIRAGPVHGRRCTRCSSSWCWCVHDGG